MKKIQKIFHVADIHFRNFRRHDEFRTICENFIHQVKKANGDRIVITGDLVESRNQISPELVNEITWFLRECAMVAEKVILIPGNHDIVEQNKERLDILTPVVSALGFNNIIYLKTSCIYNDENIAWVCYNIYDENKAPDNIPSDNKRIKIGLYHGVINGSKNDFGYEFNHGSDVDKFDLCDIVLCGDIHKRQVLETKNNVKIIYAGSMIQQNFGESSTEHGYNLVTINENNIEHKFYNIPNPVKYLTFKITDIEDIQNNSEVLING